MSTKVRMRIVNFSALFIGFLLLLGNTAQGNKLIISFIGLKCIIFDGNCFYIGADLFSLPTIYQRIYKEVDNIKACFRLLNATHQIGCSGKI